MSTQIFTCAFLVSMSMAWIGCPQKPAITNEEVVLTDSVPEQRQDPIFDAVRVNNYDVFGPHHTDFGESSIASGLERTKNGKVSGYVVVKMRNPETKILCLDKYLSTIAIALSMVDIIFPEGLVASVLTEKDFIFGDSSAITQITSKKIVEDIDIGGEKFSQQRWEFTVDSDPGR